MTARAVASTSRRPCPGPTDLAAGPGRQLRRAARALILGIGSAGLCVALSGCFSAPPQIISLEPNRGSTGVLADAPVRVIFDRPVLRSSVIGRFTVDHAIPGCDLNGAFAAPDHGAVLDPVARPGAGFELLHAGAVFAPLTKYTFTLSGGFTDPQGDRNGLDHHWDLTSAPAPRITAVTPAARSSDVPIDAPIAVGFSAPMDARSTAAAITLPPAVPGTVVSRNALDHSRFAILPGQLLEPGVTYTITVGGSARGEDEQALAAPGAIQFSTGARLGGAHAVVLAGAPGANSTQVLLPALAPAAAGDPIAAPVLLQAPVCTASLGCGTVAAQAPLTTYEAASAAPDGSHIAVVVDDVVSGSAQLEVVDTIHDTTLTRISGGVRPSWSPDSSELALVTGSQVEVLDIASGVLTVVDSGYRAARAAPVVGVLHPDLEHGGDGGRARGGRAGQPSRRGALRAARGADRFDRGGGVTGGEPAGDHHTGRHDPGRARGGGGGDGADPAGPSRCHRLRRRGDADGHQPGRRAAGAAVRRRRRHHGGEPHPGGRRLLQRAGGRRRTPDRLPRVRHGGWDPGLRGQQPTAVGRWRSRASSPAQGWWPRRSISPPDPGRRRRFG